MFLSGIVKRLPQLDGLRGIAILLVLIWHYVVNQFGLSSTLGSRLCFPFGLSWSGVDLFFVLSGFLIVGVLIDHRNSSNYFRVFYLRRACRIWPLYFIVLISFVCLSATRIASSQRFEWLFAKPVPLWSYASFTQNFFMVHGFGANWLAVTWSLAVEEQFYLVIPLLVRFVPQRHLLRIFFGVALTGPLLRFLIDPATLRPLVSTPCRTDALLFGACIAVMVRSPGFGRIKEYRENLRGALFLLLLGMAVMTLAMHDPLGSFVHLWVAAFYSVLLVIVLIDRDTRLNRLLRYPPLIWLGHLSFAIYLFHQPIAGLVHGIFRGAPPGITNPHDLLLTILSLLITLLLAALSYRFLEKPMIDFGHSHMFASPAVPVAVSLTVMDPKAETAERLQHE